MREIKFRAWDKEAREMLPNVQNHIGNFDTAFGNMLRNERYELMQYTGLHDKNGKEIYEGDIVDWRGQYSENAPQPVIWYYTGWYAGYANKHLNITSLNAIEPKTMEIIGNIYENKDLLNDQP